MRDRRIGLGIAGWGAAGKAMAAALRRSRRVVLAGVCDPDPAARARASGFGAAPVDADLAGLLARPEVDVVYLATPTPGHAEQLRQVCDAGRHVIVEKPITTSTASALAATRYARAAGILLLVGETHSYDAPVVRAAELIDSGRFGAPLGITSICHTNWLTRRPRSAADLDPTRGGGLLFRQGAHQFDVLRRLAGGLTQTVSARALGPDPSRPRGSSARLEFPAGLVAIADYSGTGGLDGTLLSFGRGEVPDRPPPRDELAARYFALPANLAAGVPMFGQTIITCESATLVPTPDGVLSFAGGRPQLWPLGELASGWDALLAELDAALATGLAWHDGEWGTATLEVCELAHRCATAATPGERPRHQVPFRPRSFRTDPDDSQESP